MAALPTRTTASFAAIAPVPSLAPLDAEFNASVGAAGFLNGGTTGTKLLVKTSDASDPPIEQDQVGAGPLAEWKQNGTLKVSIANSGQIVSAVTTGTAPFSVASTTEVTNLNAATVGGIEGSNIAKLDTHKTAFSVSFFEADPTITGGVTEAARQSFFVPDGASMTVTKLRIKFQEGSHTAGGTLTYTFRFRGADGSTGNIDFGTVTLDNTNNTIHVTYTNDIGDFVLTAGGSVTYYKSTATGTISERAVSFGFVGTQKLTT